MKHIRSNCRKLLIWLVVFILVFSTSVFGDEGYISIKKTVINVFVNGKKVNTTGILFDNTPYVPVNQIAELMGAKTGWDKATNTASINYATQLNPDGKVSFGTAIDCTIQNYKGDTFSLKMDKSYENVKIAFLEDEKGKAVKASVDIKGNLANVSQAIDILLGKRYKLFILLNDGGVKTYQFKTPEYIKIDLNTSRDYFVPANPGKGFHYPYFISFKAGNSLPAYKNTVLFDTNNNHLTYSNQEMVDKMKGSILQGSEYLYDIGMKGNYITVMFLFPRPMQLNTLYTHALDRDTLMLTKAQSDELGRGDLTKLDRQYLAVMEDAKAQLKMNGKIVENKVFLHGFSASADFATRFSLLHPEVVKGIVVNASPTMPFTEYKGVDLKFPLGVSDLKQLTGTAFNKAAYQKIPQFWHSGSIDGNDGTYYGDGWGNYGDPEKNWNAEGIDYRKAFGDEITTRKRLISKVLVEKGFTNITFKEYKGKNHEFTGEMQEDALKFLAGIK